MAYDFFPRYRNRVTETFTASGLRRTSPVLPFSPYLSTGTLSEKITDQRHSGYGPGGSGLDGDVGGPLFLERRGIASATMLRVPSGNPYVQGTVGAGSITGYTVGSLTPTPASASVGSLNSYGASAVAASLPTNPNASLAVALGELHADGLPKIPGASLKEQTAIARRAGDEYLNVEFGWLPLVRDLQAFAHSVKDAHALIAQYRKGSDQKIRRRAGGPSVASSGVFSGVGSMNPSNTGIITSCTASETYELRYWFSGAFRYHVPIGDSTWERLSRYEQYSNYLFGTRITPEVVWNLAPWSWAVDWFTNAGDVIHNISTLGFDGLVMQYGYAMRQELRKAVIVHTTTGNGFSGVAAGLRASRTEVIEFKQRVPANPYGFGIDDISLSKTQLAILAALGLTRGKRYH